MNINWFSYFIKNKTFIYSLLAFTIVYGILRLFVFHTDPLILLTDQLSEPYLLLSEKIGSQFLQWTGSRVNIENHLVFSGNSTLEGFIPVVRYKKIMLIILLIIWTTNASLKEKGMTSILLAALHLFFNSLFISVGAYLASLDYYDESLLSIPHTIALLCFLSLLFIWYLKHKGVILERLSKLRKGKAFFEKKGITIFIILYLYIIVIHFFLVFFYFSPWINFLFTASRKILALFGYTALVEPFHLVGNNGSIYMAKYCLGFKTMFLFASLIYLTGDNKKIRWIYILSGLIFLNFVNIMRFVFLFIHIQKHNGYALAMDLHDMYNYITYFIIFILWVFWFEKFSDIKPAGAETKSPPEKQ